MRDFFISYNKADRSWAEWIAWHLEKAGFSTFLQAWDFRPGSNFVFEMQKATTEAKRTVAVISDSYLGALYTLPEWAAAFAQDPTGEKGILLPVRVQECELVGLLSQIVYIDFVGVEEADALQRLLEGITRSRVKPTSAPGFPKTIARPKHFPGDIEDRRKRFNRTVYTATRQVTTMGLNIASVAALVWGVLNLPQHLEKLLGRPVLPLAIALSFLPLVATTSFNSIPAWIRRMRKRRLIERGLRGSTVEAGYFRIHPFSDDAHDQQRYSRADNAHHDIFSWLHTTAEPVLYLTGRSGAGKTSLLNAYVLPQLRQASPPVIALTVRSFHDPEKALRNAVLNSVSIWPEPSPDNLSTRELLEVACHELNPRHLLIIFDQFEEFLIIHDQVPDQPRSLEVLLASILEKPIPGLKVLFVIRSDYLGKLQDLALPSMRQNDNWKEVSPFTERAARDFLTRSGLTIGPKLMDNIISQAAQIEEANGLVRPITLNMIGLIIDRVATRTDESLPKRRVGDLLIGYIRSCIDLPEVKEYSRQILRGMITPAGTKRPRSVADLSRETGFNKNGVSGCLLVLSTYGVVRQIDERNKIWEVSHDFVARLLTSIVTGWRRSIAQNVRPWIAPASLVVWVALFLMVLPQYFERRNNQILNAIAGRGGTFSITGGRVNVSLDSDAKEINLTLQQLKSLTNLYGLDLSETSVTDAEMVHVRSLKSLESLNLGLTKITNLSLTYVKELDKLHVLDLNDTQITDEGLAQLRTLLNLEELNLENNPLNGPGLNYLEGLTKLKKLYLGTTRTTDPNLQSLEGMVNLQELYLDHTEITDEGLAHLRELRNLRRLDLDDNTIDGHGLAYLSKLQDLRILYLNHTNVTDTNLEALKNFRNLQELNLSGTPAGNGMLSHISGLTSLRELWLKETKVTDEGFILLQGLPNLQVLAVPVTETTDEGLRQIGNLASLKQLYAGGTKITDNGLVYLKNLNNLQLLYLPVTKITDAGLLHLVSLTALKEMDLSGTKVTPHGVEQLRHSLPNLSIKR